MSIAAGQRWTHVKRGTTYEVIGIGELQMSEDVVDGSSLVIYRGDDGKLWAREEGEFLDGRFQPVSDRYKFDPRMTPTNDAPVTVEQCDRAFAADILDFIAGLRSWPDEIQHTAGVMRQGAKGRLKFRPLVEMLARHRLAALASAYAGDGVIAEVVELARRDIAREQTDFLGRMGEAVSTYQGIFDDYPDGDLPEDVREEAEDEISALAGLALAQLVLLRHPSDGTDPAAALARTHSAVTPAGDGVPFRNDDGEIVPRDELLSNFKAWLDPFWQRALDYLARPRAAVGEQSREAIARIIDPEAWQDVSNEDTYPAMLRRIAEGKAASLAKADAILALQSPPAKVEGRREALSRMVAIDEELGLYDE